MSRSSLLPTIAVLAAASMVAGCSGRSTETDKLAFHHDIATSAQPWTHQRFDAAEDKFTFAVFSDLTGGERERVS